MSKKSLVSLMAMAAAMAEARSTTAGFNDSNFPPEIVGRRRTPKSEEEQEEKISRATEKRARRAQRNAMLLVKGKGK